VEKIPDRLQAFMSAAMRELTRDLKFRKNMTAWAITYEEFDEIKEWFKKHEVEI